MSFSPVSAQLPLRQSRRKERQFGMLIFHELTYLQNWAQAAVGLRGPGLGLRWEERKGLFSTGFTCRGACLSGELSKLFTSPQKPMRNAKPSCLLTVAGWGWGQAKQARSRHAPPHSQSSLTPFPSSTVPSVIMSWHRSRGNASYPALLACNARLQPHPFHGLTTVTLPGRPRNPLFPLLVHSMMVA